MHVAIAWSPRCLRDASRAFKTSTTSRRTKRPERERDLPSACGGGGGGGGGVVVSLWSRLLDVSCVGVLATSIDPSHTRRLRVVICG